MRQIDIQLRIDADQYPDLYAYLAASENKFFRARTLKEICEAYLRKESIVLHPVLPTASTVQVHNQPPIFANTGKPHKESHPKADILATETSNPENPENSLHVPIDHAINPSSFSKFG